METQTTYTQARANLAKLFDQVTQNNDIVIVSRRSGGDVALVSAHELSSLLETARLLRSPKNAQRLLTAYRRAKRRVGNPQTPERLRREVGLEAKK